MNYQDALYELSEEFSSLDCWIEKDGEEFKVMYGGGG